jgi:hypothetical protein
MDEVLSECDDVTEALTHHVDLIALLTSAGFPLRKWCSNHPRILEAVPTAAQEIVLLKKLSGEDKVRTLGLCCHPTLDKFTTANSKKLVALTDVSNVRLLQF